MVFFPLGGREWEKHTSACRIKLLIMYLLFTCQLQSQSVTLVIVYMEKTTVSVNEDVCMAASLDTLDNTVIGLALLGITWYSIHFSKLFSLSNVVQYLTFSSLVFFCLENLSTTCMYQYIFECVLIIAYLLFSTKYFHLVHDQKKWPLFVPLS